MQTIIAKSVPMVEASRHQAVVSSLIPDKMPENDRGSQSLAEAFDNSSISREYARAFGGLNDLPVALQSVEELRKAYVAGRVATTKEHEPALKLLAIFAQHLSKVNSQRFVQREHAEPPVIARARAYIQEHQTEELSLGRVARAVNMSSYYFCKMFKKATGLNFTDYVARVRIEKSKDLLLDPNLRVSEIAYEVGFQSLTHFNRVFKKMLGQSPTEYRAQFRFN